MTEEIGLIIKGKVRADKGSMDRLGKDAARSVGGSIKQSIRSLGSSFGSLKGIRSSLSHAKSSLMDAGSSMPKFLGGGGMGEGKMGSMLGTLAGMTIILKGVWDAGKKAVSYLANASPILQGTLKMLNMGFMMVLRPLGDTIAMMLRPIAFFFRSIGRRIMMDMKKRIEEDKAKGMSGLEISADLMAWLPGEYMTVFADALTKVDWVSIFSQVFSGFTSSGGTAILGAILLAIGTMAVLATLGGLVLATMLLSIGTMSTLGTLGTTVFSKITGAIGEMSVLGGLGTAILAAALLAVNSYVNSPQSQSDVEKMLGVTKGNNPGGAQIEGTYVDWSTKPSAATGEGQIGESFKGADLGSGSWTKPFEDFYNALGFHGPILQEGGQITKTGLVKADAGEVVKDRGEIRDMIVKAVSDAMGAHGGGGGNTYLTIPGAALADAIDRRADVRIDLFAQRDIRRRGL